MTETPGKLDSHTDAYREGFKAGYAKGWDDGHPTGFVDAKARTYAALEAAENIESKHAVDSIRNTIATALGRPA